MKIMLISVVVLFALGFQSSGAPSTDPTRIDIEVLLGMHGHLLNNIKGYQVARSLTDNQVREVLHDFIRTEGAPYHDDARPAGRESDVLLENAVYALLMYGDETSLEVLAPLMKSPNVILRQHVVRVFMRMTDHTYRKEIQGIIEGPGVYDDRDRANVYWEMEKAYGDAKHQKDGAKCSRILQALEAMVVVEDKKWRVKEIDSFLEREGAGYKNSALRKNLLRKHAVEHDGKSSEFDAYFRDALKREDWQEGGHSVNEANRVQEEGHWSPVSN